jgi:hypothetical protein
MVMLMDQAQDGLREDHQVFEKNMRKIVFENDKHKNIGTKLPHRR